MAGGTHVFDMIKRLKENENLKKNNYFKAKGHYSRASKSTNVDYKQATKAEREEIRRRIGEERKAEQRKIILTLIVSTVLTAALIFLFLRFVWP